MSHDVAVVPGDGIGPEVTAAARRVVDATGAGVVWHEAPVGQAAYRSTGQALPPSSVDTVRRCGVVLKGPLVNPTSTAGYPSPNMALRAEFDMFANVRPCRLLVPGDGPELDVVVIREMTEGILAGADQAVGPDAAVAISSITRAATTRVARFACDWAVRNGRKRITVAHKASILRRTDGLFLSATRDVVADYAGLEFAEVMVDTAATQLIRNPGTFDVIVTGSQYGDILSDVCSGLIGGPGVIPGATYGDGVAFFESVHGAAPKYAGQDRADPAAFILSAAALLRHLGEATAAETVENAVRAVVAEGRTVTPDLGGTATTTAMTDAIAARC
jgi:isocitrate dehydrogenase (NAD+)